MKRPFWLIAGVAFALRCSIAFGSLDALDRGFVPDDTYYTLGFARALAHGLGPTVDGVVLSNGFQPLLAFLLVPVFWVTETADMALRSALLLGTLCDVAIVLLLGRIAEHLAGRSAGLITAGLWAISPLAIANALCGLETSLTLALELALVLAHILVRDQERLAPEISPVPQWVALGGLAGLSILARVDAVFLVAAIVLLELPGLRNSRAARRGRSIAAACGALVLLPWWSYSIIRFGTPIPESGSAVLQITRLHRALYLTVPKQLGWAAGSAFGAPIFDLPSLRELLLGEPLLSELAFAAVGGALLVAAWRFIFVGQKCHAERRAAGALVLHALAVLSFYALVLPALWFFRRYLAPCQAVFTLLFGLSLSWLWQKSRAASPIVVRAACGGAWLAASVLSLLGAVRLYQFTSLVPGSIRDSGLHGAKGYREAARSVLAQVPEGAVLGAFQSGALSYYAPKGLRVVNLDGVVDRGARVAVAQLRLADYASSRGVTYLADWQFNLDAFTRLSKSALARPTMRLVPIQMEPQGADSFVLLEVRWPDTAADQRKTLTE